MVCMNPVSSMCIQYRQKGQIRSNPLARRWMEVINEVEVEVRNRNGLALWNYVTNLTEYNLEEKRGVERATVALTSIVLEQTKSINVDQPGLDPQIKRLYNFYGSDLFTFNNPSQLRYYGFIRGEMRRIYHNGKVCAGRTFLGRPQTSHRCLQIEPDLTDLMAMSRDANELLWAWKGWRDAVGRPMRDLYPIYVNLSNVAAVNKGFSNEGESWLHRYEDPDFVDDIDSLWESIKPLYLQVHAYVRRRLVDYYGSDVVDPHGPIPAHLLGNMWAQEWNNIYDIVEPYPGHGAIDVTNQMKDLGWTAENMFAVANQFFTSLGLESMPRSFWAKSMMVKPRNREVSCHGSSLDFYKNEDVRIKMCTEVNMQDLFTVHHEMGHCQYYLQYRNQHALFRDGANPGFHEAVGDTVSLSVITPSYLNRIGLLQQSLSNHTDAESSINFLMKVALFKLVFLPYGLLVDKWRWQAFKGEIQPNDYNQAWWNLRKQYQGIQAPIPRSPDDFDPGAKFHVATGTPYVRYFVSFVIQFQFHKALCDVKGEQGPLHLCNIYNSKEAGRKFRYMLKMGASKPWHDAMEVMTGQRKMDAKPLLEYIQPLTEWLRNENQGKFVGWT
ncbi:angiotensin-converting enzyme-like [Lytechinus variegatus]|uniref:angiotensin-converting enzyme-like n=1 Tax=Lytechinus variegatus TaxID=7654 RepID=UPI001BB239D7|nr:angiotensin-converting enzyme-like [Lytechinus variegatus]